MIITEEVGDVKRRGDDIYRWAKGINSNLPIVFYVIDRTPLTVLRLRMLEVEEKDIIPKIKARKDAPYLLEALGLKQ